MPPSAVDRTQSTSTSRVFQGTSQRVAISRTGYCKGQNCLLVNMREISGESSPLISAKKAASSVLRCLEEMTVASP